MKILLFFSTLLFTGVLMPRVGSDQPVSNPVPLFTTMCIWKFEKLSSKTHNSSTVFDKGRYETEERNTDRSKEHHAVFNMWDACIKLSGQCKRHCGEDQYRIAYCARHRVDCCMKRCKPVEK